MIKMKRKLDLTYTILVLAVLVALGFVLLLAKENNNLKTRLLNAVADPQGASGDISGPPELLVGDRAIEFEALDLSGEPHSVKYGGDSKYVFYVFSPFCGTCMRQSLVMGDLLGQAKAGGYNTIALSLEDPGERKSTLAHLGKSAQVLVMPDISVQRTFRATSIPLLLIVGSNGKVEWVHYGILPEGKMKEFSTRVASLH
jgi:peroxiredoxin